LEAISELPGPLELIFVPFSLIFGAMSIAGEIGGALVAGGPNEHWYVVIENLNDGMIFVLEQTRRPSSDNTDHVDDGYCKKRKVRKGKDIADWLERYRDNFNVHDNNCQDFAKAICRFL
jgi:hypothetical protein